MPLYGTLDITRDAAHLPTLANLDTEAWTLPKAETMQLLVEVPRSACRSLPDGIRERFFGLVGEIIATRISRRVAPVWSVRDPDSLRLSRSSCRF